MGKSSRRAPVSELLLGLNAIFDSQRLHQEEGLSSEFRITLDRIEKHLIVQMTTSVPPTVLANATYFFCKF